ncbi:putative Ig domain-containing protein [Arsenicibacter rosenii]|uniref:putative Ig domain-containing protein n=1 Tax=Arsenicibacter rosenii TaxID=1750698 RepID=UPI000B0BEDFE|nr:putative Ig domain-containing protein [Arsenicibacter rosenii]
MKHRLFFFFTKTKRLKRISAFLTEIIVYAIAIFGLQVDALAQTTSPPSSTTTSPPSSVTFNKSTLDYSGVDYANIRPASPNAAALGTYGEIPVSLYTGTPNIQIPLYELAGVELKLPLSLSYRASGIRVDENASWVGLGWSLEAGGVITRTVRDKAEFEANATRAVLPLSTNTSSFNQLQSINYLDFEADIFHYNFMGYSGSFVFDATGKPKFSNTTNFSVTYKAPSSPDYQSGFIIVTDNGNTFEFKATETTSTGASSVTAWFLTKVTSASEKETILFSYTEEIYSYNTPIRFSKMITPNGTGSFLLPKGYSEEPRIHYGVYIAGKRLSQITFQGLGTVEFIPSIENRKDLSMQNAAYSAKYLDEIRIKDINGTQKKRFDLEYEFVKTNDTYPGTSGAICTTPESCTYLNYRLYLSALKDISDPALSNPPTYRFGYYDRTPQGEDRLPHRVSAAQDHWGYFNGRNYNQDLWPGFCGPFGSADPNFRLNLCYPGAGTTSLALWQVGRANREPAFPASRYGSLQKITYPTGGQSEFIYEPHQYQSIGSTAVTQPTSDELYCFGIELPQHYAGGLRIKEIINRIDGLPVKQTEYQYEDGVLRAKPHYYTYFHYPYTTGTGYRKSFYPNCSQPTQEAEFHLFAEVNSGMVTDHGYRGGTHIGYGKVTEKQFSLVNNARVYNGQTIYEYSTEKTYPTGPTSGDNITYVFSYNSTSITDSDIIPITNQYFWPYFPGRNWDWAHGQLLKKTVKNTTGQTVYLQESVYTNTDVSLVPAAKVFQVRQDKDYFFLNYDFIEGWPRLTYQTETTYDLSGQNGITVIKQFDYANSNHKYITSEQSTGSDGVTLQTNYSYVGDYLNSAMGGTISALKSRNILNRLIGKQSIRNGLTTEHKITGYNADGQPVSTYELETTKPVSIVVNANSIIPNSSGSAVYTQKNLLTYSNKVLQTVTQIDGMNTTYIWGYNSMRPVAEIKNATAAQVEATGENLTSLNSSNVSEATIRTTLSNLRAKLPQALVSGFTHDVLFGPTSEINPAGITSFYQYDLLGRLKQVLNNNQKPVKSYTYSNRIPGPTITTGITAISIVAGQGFTYTVPANTFSDPNPLIYIIESTGAPGWVTINGATISGTAPGTGIGTTINLSIKAQNQSGGITYATLPVVIVGTASPLTILQPLYNCQTGNVTFRYSGGDGTAVEYRALLVNNWQSSTNTFIYNPNNDDPALTLQARQLNRQETAVSYTWDWKTQCQATNLQPQVTQLIPSSTVSVGENFTVNLANHFNDPENQSMTFTVTGLPAGLNVSGAGIISGAPSTTGTYTLTVRATDIFSATATTSFVLTVNPATVQPLALTLPTYDCTTKSFAFNTTGGNGTTIEYFAIGITGWTTQRTGHTAEKYCDIPYYTLNARQSGTTVSFTWYFKNQCTCE